MYGLEEIKKMNRVATRRAKREGNEPLLAKRDGDNNVFKCPDLGNYVPKGWHKMRTYFVDSSGFGSENEPALTAGQFLKKVKAGKGYAIVEEGQFQVHIGEYIQLPKEEM
jgi:hypothetical protein